MRGIKVRTDNYLDDVYDKYKELPNALDMCVLVLLMKNDGMSGKEVGKRTKIASGSVYNILNKLIKNGYVVVYKNTGCWGNIYKANCSEIVITVNRNGVDICSERK